MAVIDFITFVLLNAVLFVRPTEIVPQLEGLPVYEVLIVACLVGSFPAVLEQLQFRALVARPVTICIVGLLIAIVLSHLVHSFVWGARMSAFEFSKLLAYYLLLVSILNSSVRLRQFLLWLVGLTALLTVLALLQFHGIINVTALAAVEQREVDEVTGESSSFPRLCSTGIFNDPNDLCLILVSSMVVSVYWLGERRRGIFRFLWLAPLSLFGYAAALTQSRGGVIALITGCLILLLPRFGGRKTIAASAIVLPLAVMFFAGRRGNVTLSTGTGQTRLQLWSEGLHLFSEAPIFGIGQGLYAETVGQVAHNSFLHCYTELGFFGGTLFLGAFIVVLWGLYWLGSRQSHIPDPELRRLQPYMLALVSAYAAGILSLSRAYVVPTYMVLGLAAAYVRLAVPPPSLPMLQFDTRLVCRLTVASVAFVVCTYGFVRVFVRW